MDKVSQENAKYLLSEMRQINSSIELKIIGNKFFLTMNSQPLSLSPMKYSELYGFRCGFLAYHKMLNEVK